MRVVFLGNNWVGWQLLQWLTATGEEIVAVVVHAPGKQKFCREMLQCVEGRPTAVFEAPQLDDPGTLEAIRALRPDIAVSVLFDEILRPPLLGLFPRGTVNLHPSYLPYNRGQYPNVWSIVEGTPAGVTLCYIDRGIDTGDIIEQREVPVEPIDTGETLYRKLERASIDLFKDAWPRIADGTAGRTPQDHAAGTSHRTRDVDAIDEIHLDRQYSARYLIDLLRARTFRPYAGAYFTAGGRRVYLRLELTYEDQLEAES